MAIEGQSHPFYAGIYWTISTMTTLGLGDVVFTELPGRVLTTVVVMSGIVYFLIFIPFILIRFFQSVERAPRDIPEQAGGHIILTHADVVTSAFIRRLNQYEYSYVMVLSDLEQALRLHDQGYHILMGDTNDVETFRSARVDHALLVALTSEDAVNASMALKIRELHQTVPVVTTAQSLASTDVLMSAGCTSVIRLREMLGQSLARRTIGGDALTHTIGQFGSLLIAEATVTGTPMVNRRLRDSNLRELTGLSVLGTWERGIFSTVGPDTMLTDNTVLVLAGSQQQLKKYDELFCIYNLSGAPVLIIGGGGVGRATSTDLIARGVDVRIIDSEPCADLPDEVFVRGDATDPTVLEKAGIRDAPTVIITTHDDPVNIYLTIHCRRVRPDIKIISRATLESSIPTLHQAGADFVMSYASMGATVLLNYLRGTNILMIAEGLDAFRVPVPAGLEGKLISDAAIQETTGCIVVAFESDGEMQINPPPTAAIPHEGEIILIGNSDAEELFLKVFPG